MNFSDFLIKGPSAPNLYYNVKSNENAFRRETSQKIVDLWTWKDISKKSTLLLTSETVLGAIGLGTLGIVVIAHPFSTTLLISSIIAVTAYLSLTVFLSIRTAQAFGQLSSCKNNLTKQTFSTPPASPSSSFGVDLSQTLEKSAPVTPKSIPIPSQNFSPSGEFISSTIETADLNPLTQVTTLAPQSPNYQASNSPYKKNITPSPSKPNRKPINQVNENSVQLKTFFRKELLKLKDLLSENQITLVMSLFDQAMKNQKPRQRFNSLVNYYIYNPAGWDPAIATQIKNRLSRHIPITK